MSQSHSRTGLGYYAVNELRAHPNALVDLPTDTFEMRELPTDDARTLVRRLRPTDALSIEDATTGNGDTRATYELSEHAKQYRQQIIETRDTPLPCGHTGLRNVGGDEFACCYAGCDETFDRTEVDR